MKYNERSKKTIKKDYTFFGCIAGFYFFFKADGNLEELNLGQTFAKSPKYQCKNEDGINTGSGYAFEDIFFQICKSNGLAISQIEVKKNGADFLVNGVPVQLKYARSPRAVFNALFDKKTGEYRYPGQIIITNKENESSLRNLIKQNKERLNGQNIIVNPIGTPQISEEDVKKQLYRGFSSFKRDARDILTDSKTQKNIVFGMFVSFCAVIGLGAIHEYSVINSTHRNKGNKIKSVARAIKSSLKNNWLKGTIISVVTALTFFGGQIVNRQLKRPMRPRGGVLP